MSNYVKKYDVGQIQLDLPTSNYIHELPLLSFSDIYGGVNLSLVFNYQGKLENSNPFHISAGYKLNLQKRLIIVGTSIKLQEATGKIVELNKIGDRYTFEDDSQRIMRKKSCTYIIENPDYSREEYNSAGRLTEVYDKYSTRVLEYKYTTVGLLDYILYRNDKAIDFTYESNKLKTISYGGTTTTFTYDDANNKVTVNHYSDVVYTLELNEMNFEVIGNGNEGITYSTKLVKQEDNTTLSIQNCINDDVVDTTLYKYPEYLEYFDPGYRFHQVEVTNNNGVKTRVQYGYDKIECSYEINGTNDVEFCNNAYPSNVNIYNIEDKTRMNPFNGVHTFNDGVALHCTNESNQRWQVNVSMDGNTSLRGYYVLTGWIKRTAEPYADNTICISNHTAGPVETFYASATPLNEWKFFAYKFSLSANFIYVYPSCPVGIELKDVKLTFKTTHLLEENSTSYIPIIDNVLVHKTTNKIIPLIKSKFVCGDVEFAEEGYVTFNDVLKYKINKKKNINADEFYSNNLKNVHTINSASIINVIYDDVEYDLSNCYLGKMNYANQGNIVTQIVDDESNIAFYTYCDTNLRDNFDGVLLSVKKYNTNMDVVHEEKDDVAVVYERDGAGLVTKETVGSIVREFVYENGKLKETTDEFGYTTTYETDDTWGVITSIILPDGSVITDEFDGDKSTLKKRVFEKTTRRANEMLYSKGQLSQLKTSGLVYDFNYSEGKLSNIKKNNSYVEEHFQSNTKIDSYYPHEASNIYQQTMNFDKYGRLISIAGELEYNYALSSLWYDKNGKTYSGIDGETYTLFDGGKFNHSSWGGNSDGAKLSTSTDLITGQKTKYGYYQNRLVGIETHDSSDNVVSKEYYTYDKANRVKKITHNFDGSNSKSVGATITYTKDETDVMADNMVKTYCHQVNGEDKAVTTNIYDDYKRVINKIQEIGSMSIEKSLLYDKSRVCRVIESKNGYSYSDTLSSDTTYTYDEMGRIKTINNGKLISYEYDGYGQLVLEDNEVLDKTFEYCYNEIGNLTKVIEYKKVSGVLTKTNEWEYDYDISHPDRLTEFNGAPIDYDDLGCPITYDGKTFTWENGKLKSISSGVSPYNVTTYSYSYDAYGRRIQKSQSTISLSGGMPSNSTVGTSYTYDASGRLVKESTASSYVVGNITFAEKIYLYDESSVIGMIYTVDGTSNVYYFQRNLLGDVIGIYNASGTKVAGYAYDAWGNCSITLDTNGIASRNPIRYRGYYYDEDTGLYYLNARYYSPEWRRFISPDDTAYLDPESPNGLNLYAYCNNDPVNYADPSGHFPIDIILDVVFTAWSLTEFVNSPTLENFGWLALDLACLIIPYATGGSTIVKGIVKGANGVDNLLDVSKVPGYILRNADDVVVLGQNMDRVKDAVKKLGGGIIYGGLDNFADIMSKYGKETAESLGYIDNMKWMAKQAWAGKTVLNIGFEAVRLANPSAFANSFKVCRGEVLYYRLVMLGKFIAFWSHRIYRLFGG